MNITAENIFARCIPVPESGCLLWTGAWSREGYGNLWDSYLKRYTHAHRVIAQLFHGGVTSSSVFVCHKCDTPACCNPNHLFIGDNKVNAADAVKKGRMHNKFQSGKIHCIRGHPLSGENLLSYGKGRACRTCANEQQKLRARAYRKTKKYNKLTNRYEPC